MRVEFVHIGFGNVVAANRILAVISPDSAPIKRMIQEGREHNTLIDVTYGRKTKAVVVLDSGHLVLAAIQPETIAGRLAQQRDGQVEMAKVAVKRRSREKVCHLTIPLRRPPCSSSCPAPRESAKTR